MTCDCTLIDYILYIVIEKDNFGRSLLHRHQTSHELQLLQINVRYIDIEIHYQNIRWIVPNDTKVTDDKGQQIGGHFLCGIESRDKHFLSIDNIRSRNWKLLENVNESFSSGGLINEIRTPKQTYATCTYEKSSEFWQKTLWFHMSLWMKESAVRK